MKVKDLIEQLSKMPQDLEVWIQYYPEDIAIIRHCSQVTWQGGKRAQLDNYEEGHE